MSDMKPPAEEPVPDEGAITFIARHRPPLQSGRYEITVTQSVRNGSPDASASSAFDETYTSKRRFQISGHRFTINTDDVESVFPPQGSQGEYANVLPHIVFKNQTLPWERTVGDAAESSWLALLLFDESDPPPPLKEALVGDLQRDPFPHGASEAEEPSSLPSTSVSYPDLKLEYGQMSWDPCRILDVPVTLLDQILPGTEDMPWLSHSRTLTSTTPLRLAGLQDGQTGLESSVVVANRLPTPNSQVTVHLVSVENMARYLPAGEEYAGSPAALADGQPAESIRLISLFRWSYRSVDPAETFSGLLTSLDKADGLHVLAIGNSSTGESASDAYVRNALQLGYAPLDHTTRQGSRTVSWYRGPLVPMAGGAVSPSDPGQVAGISSADEAVRYDPETGMMDISYAAAWQIGRLLALRDQGFAEALVRWKRTNARMAFKAFENELLQRSLGGTLALRQVASQHDDTNTMHHAVANLLLTRLKPHLLPESQAIDGAATASSSEAAGISSLVSRFGERERFLDFLAGATSLHATGVEDPVPAPIETWLHSLKKLNGLPIGYLVPHPQMLPTESIRFFNVDPLWLHALTEGACSIGQSSELDDRLHDMAAPRLRAAARLSPQDDASAAMSGFLLRSQVVTGWPRLEVVAYDAEGNELTDVLRLERVLDSVLLFLVEGDVDRVVLREPAIGLHFGIDLKSGTSLRYVTVPGNAEPGTRPGDQIDGAFVRPEYRDTGLRTLRIAKLAHDLSGALHEQGADNAPDGSPLTFSSAEFALQLVEGTQQVTFKTQRTEGR